MSPSLRQTWMHTAWGSLCSLMPKVSACFLEGLGFIPRREVQVFFIPHFAIHCRSAYMQLWRIISLKCCGLLKKLHLQICICAVVKQNNFKSCGLEVVGCWIKLWLRICSCEARFYLKLGGNADAEVLPLRCVVAIADIEGNTVLYAYAQLWHKLHAFWLVVSMVLALITFVGG
jgi:hypothetical protein